LDAKSTSSWEKSVGIVGKMGTCGHGVEIHDVVPPLLGLSSSSLHRRLFLPTSYLSATFTSAEDKKEESLMTFQREDVQQVGDFRSSPTS
jgi:hypothetical protein